MLCLLVMPVFIFSCGKQDPVTGEYLLPPSSYTINGNSFEGQGKHNTRLKVLEIPCNNNNTIRMYISDSFDIYEASLPQIGFSRLLNIVSYQKAGRLNRTDCYLEVSTSVGDTWLSTGTGIVMVKMKGEQYFTGSATAPYADAMVFYFVDAPVQHFTSVLLSDFSKVTGTFKIK